MKSRSLLISGSLLMALAVAFGAFGAHVVEDMLTPERFEVYQTAVQYHFYHAIGLLLIGVISLHLTDSRLLIWSGNLLFTGIIIFSGSLYLLTLTDTSWLGMITPLGGFAFIGGWVFLSIAVYRYLKP
jgi:uncharacterized membrane protein YgdD (TMEM256/DUF423 family)